MLTQFPEVSALGLGGFVFGNGDKLGAAVRGSEQVGELVFLMGVGIG